jgi:phage terminase small subunit
MPVLHNAAWEAIARAYVLESLTKSAAYLHGFPQNASKAPGYISTHVGKIFDRPIVQARVAELQGHKTRAAEEEFKIDANTLLRDLVDVRKMDIADILDDEDNVLPVHEWPEVWRQTISGFDVEALLLGRGENRSSIGVLKKIKGPDKLRVLDMIGKHIGVNAFKDVKEIQGPGGGPVQVITSTMTAKQAAAAYADTLNNK